MALPLSACAIQVDPAPAPPDGYDAIQFLETVKVRDHAVNMFTFQVGTVLVADMRTKDGPAYCGAVHMNEVPVFSCFGFRPPGTLVIAPTAGFKEVDRPLDPQSFERIKVKSRSKISPTGL